MAYNVNIMTMWKTVTYFLMFTDICGAGHWIGTDSSLTLTLLFYFPNGVWIGVPLLAMYHLWPSFIQGQNEKQGGKKDKWLSVEERAKENKKARKRTVTRPVESINGDFNVLIFFSSKCDRSYDEWFKKSYVRNMMLRSLGWILFESIWNTGIYFYMTCVMECSWNSSIAFPICSKLRPNDNIAANMNVLIVRFKRERELYMYMNRWSYMIKLHVHHFFDTHSSESMHIEFCWT